MEQGSGTQVWNKVWNKGLDRGLERRSGSWSGTKGQPANDPYQNILTHCHMPKALLPQACAGRLANFQASCGLESIALEQFVKPAFTSHGPCCLGSRLPKEGC